MEPYNIENSEKPSFINFVPIALYVFFRSIICFPIWIFVLLIQYYKERSFYKEYTGYETLNITEKESALNAYPVVVLPVAEVFRTARIQPKTYSKEFIYDSLKALGLEYDENSHEEKVEEAIELFDPSIKEFGELKSKNKYHVTLSNTFYLPRKNSDFRELLDNLLAKSHGQQVLEETKIEFPNLSTIPWPFLTDFASIPLGVPVGSYTRAAIVHDWGYSYFPERDETGRKKCDLEMLDIMRTDGTSPFRRSIIFIGLRMFGSWPFFCAPYRRLKLIEIRNNIIFLGNVLNASTLQAIQNTNSMQAVNMIPESAAKEINGLFLAHQGYLISTIAKQKI